MAVGLEEQLRLNSELQALDAVVPGSPRLKASLILESAVRRGLDGLVSGGVHPRRTWPSPNSTSAAAAAMAAAAAALLHGHQTRGVPLASH